MYKQPSRQACDRCHDQKLRCHRDDGGKCSRCRRAGANCLFSPSNRGRRPTHQDRRNGSHISKWTSDRPLAMGLAPQMPYSPNTHLRDIDLLNREYSEGDLQAITVDRTPIAGAEIPEPTLSNLCMGVDQDVPFPESFIPSLSLPGASLGSAIFSRLPTQNTAPCTLITDHQLPLLESFPGPSVPNSGNRIGPDIPPLSSQQSELSLGPTSHRKIGSQTQFLQKFMEGLLELDIDLIRLTLEEPLLYNPAPMTPETDNSNSPSSSECSIDRIFLLTQRLIKLLRVKGNCPVESPAVQNTHCQSPLSASSTFSSRFQQLIAEPQSTSGNSGTKSQQPGTRLDQPSLLHALSTYIRLIEAYYNTFSQTAERFGAALAKGMPIPLPSLQIGVFFVDDPASHIELVIQSALRLLDGLGDSVNKLTAPFVSSGNAETDNSQPSSPSSENNAIKMVIKSVRERESRLMQAAAQLQSCCQEGRQSRE
ncbi:unnamed protein product [Penicillium egyptiacum]|uniref:Zn(2)-C6 fungal-type domain-containing protein n=1 Tax=Penicillium egyptiacum TaxID=1303716 RepID=A0A9W4P0N7_9EURO|nr:unnamed protein product [Penicillium egyptiacum]